MSAELSVTPAPAPAGIVRTVTGMGFARRKTQLLLDNVVLATFWPSGTRPWTRTLPPAPVGSQTLTAKQLIGGRWSMVARLAPLLTFQPTTGGDTTPPVLMSQAVINVTSTSVVVTWSTNELSDSYVDYGLTTGYGSNSGLDSNFTTHHNVTISGLIPSTTYHFRLTTKDPYGNTTVGSDIPVTTLASGGDTTAPVISNIVVSGLGTTGVTISWDVSEGATGQIEYGLTTAYGSASSPELSFAFTHHSQSLTGLTPATTYHYRLKSGDPSGNIGYSVDSTFTTTSTSAFPPDRTAAQFVAVTRPSSSGVPAYLVAQTDPTFGTQVERISNVSGVRHFYSRYQAWSYDGGLIYQPNFGGGNGKMIDGNTYAVLVASFGGLSNAVWCNTSRLFYGVDGGGANILYQEVVNSDGTAGAITAKHTFAAGYTVWIGGDSSSWEGGISDDDRYICLTLTDVGHGGGDLLAVYDTVADTFVTRAKPANMDNAQISRLGNYVVVVGSPGGSPETRVWPRSLSGSGTQLWPYANHGDNSLDAAGAEIFVSNNTVVGGVTSAWSYRLSDGQTIQLLPSGHAYADGHTGGHAINRPGWVYFSTYNTTTMAGRAINDAVIAVKTDGSYTHEVFGFVYHDNTATYADQPQASPSRDGKRVIAASEWQSGTPGNSYDFVLGLTV